MFNIRTNAFPFTTIHSAIDCFRMGRTNNQLRRLYLPSTQSLSSVESSEPNYISVNSLNTNGDADPLDEISDDADAITDDNEDNFIYGINLNANNHRPCKAKAAHDAVLGKIDASLVKKTLTDIKAPHLDTTSLLTKLDDVAKTVNLDVSTILAEQIKDPVLGTVRPSLRKRILSDAKSPEIQKNRRDYIDIAKVSTDSCSKKKDKCYAITSLRTNWRKKIYELAYPHHSS